MGKERRQFERSEIEKAASYGIPEESLQMHEMRITNISIGGFCIQSKNKLDRKKKIQLVFALDNNEQCVLPVKVAWEKVDPSTGDYLYGVEIHYPHHIEYNKLLAFVDKFDRPAT